MAIAGTEAKKTNKQKQAKQSKRSHLIDTILNEVYVRTGLKQTIISTFN